MAYRIHNVGFRRSLKPRREPYFARVRRGEYIGFRKLEDGSGTWIARRRNDDGRQEYKSLGFESERFGFDEASAAAEAWFKLKEHDIKDEIVTVSDACRRYVEERRTSKSEECSHDAHRRFERTIYGRRDPDSGEVLIPENALGKRALAKLRTAHIKSWRDGLGLAPGASKRTLTALKGALNLAVRERNVVATQAQEWREVKPLPGGNKRRDLFLDLDQRRALLAAASAEEFQQQHGKALRDLIEAATLTGARAGELVKARRSQFDARTGTMTFISGKGNDGPRSRAVPLAPAAITLFSRLAKNKLPNAYLLTRADGERWQHSDWDELIRAAAKKAKLPAEPKAGVCMYTLRHSWITEALMQGMTTLDVARLVGTSVLMIEKHYGHLVSSAARERLAKVELL
jgi:integrase